MLAIIDNYDSFTYNLVQYLGVLGADMEVHRNDQVTVEAVAALRPAGCVISPGPCTPREAGISVELIRRLSGTVPILGVCLGHQAVAAAFGGRIVGARRIMHGKTSMVALGESPLYAGLSSPVSVGRYHSLAIERESCPAELVVDAETEDGEIMGVHHRSHPTFGIQFHPESILTTCGKRLLRNFLKLTRPTERGENQ